MSATRVNRGEPGRNPGDRGLPGSYNNPGDALSIRKALARVVFGSETRSVANRVVCRSTGDAAKAGTGFWRLR